MIPASGCILFPPSHALFFRKKKPGLYCNYEEAIQTGHGARIVSRSLLRYPCQLFITFLHSPAVYGSRVETYGPYSQDYMRSCFDFMFILTTDLDNVNDIIERYKNSFF